MADQNLSNFRMLARIAEKKEEMRAGLHPITGSETGGCRTAALIPPGATAR